MWRKLFANRVLGRAGVLLRTILWACAAFSAVAPQGEVRGAEPTAAAAPAANAAKTALDDVLAKRKDIADQIAALAKPANSVPADAQTGDVSAAEDETEFLEALDGVFGEQQVRLEQLQELKAEKAAADEALQAFRKFGPTEPKPYSFLLLEDLRDELAAEEERIASLDADLKPAKQMLDMAQERFAQAEKNRRRAQEALTENKATERATELAAALKLAQKESQVAKEWISVRRWEFEVRTLRSEVCAPRITLLKEKIELIGKDVHFAKHDLQERLQDLIRRDALLAVKLKECQAGAKANDTQQAAAISDLRDRKTPQAILDLAQVSLRVARDAQQMEASLLNERIGDNKRLAHYWECRFEVENGTAKPAEIEEWSENLDDLSEEIRDNRHSLEQRIEGTLIEEAKIVQRMQDSDDPLLKKWGAFQRTQWQKLRDVCENQLVQLKVSQRWADRFAAELEAQLDPAGKKTWHSIAAEHFATVWAYELFQVNDQPITAGKIVTLLVWLAVSVALASLLSRFLGGRLLPRFGLNEGASRAVQSIAFYSLAVLFGVASFEMVHIPLSAFAFLGGAVAIAVGFGSQDIANNFMSGIILLAEQPIRVGDIIVVDSVQGKVEHIGPRSTRIKTDSNHEMIVPNSKVLSDKLTNLTLSDTLIQTTVAVTLPNTIPVPQAKVLLLQAALSQQSVLNEPSPVVLFKQFGAAAMDFELHFWLQLSDEMRAAIAQSEVREAINEQFLLYNAQPTITTAPTVGGPLPSSARRANAA